MAETNKKSQLSEKTSKNATTKVNAERRKLILERAKRIQAAKKTAEAKRAVEERKARMAKRAEAKKANELNKKSTATHNKNEKAATPQQPKSEKPNANKSNNKVATVAEDFEELAVSARKYKTLYTEKYKNRKFWENPNPNLIQSFIPGTIIAIDVKEGRVVKEGTKIITLEAMKMQNKIEMPFTARIKKIYVKVGEKIPKDSTLIELEPTK